MNDTYLSERKYIETEVQMDKKVLKYWTAILGKEVYDKINLRLNGGLDRILSNQVFEAASYIEESDIWKAYISQEWLNEELVKEKELSDLIFGNFIIPFLKIANGLLGVRLKDKTTFINNQKIILSDFQKITANKLLGCCGRTLIFEMDLSKKNGELKGKTPEEKYEDYVTHWLTDQEYVNEIIQAYPALLRLMVDVIHDKIEFYSEIIEFYETDKEEIYTKLDILKKDWKDFSVGGSDSHDHGKSVATITYCDGKKIVYKPHTVNSENAYHRYLQWVGNMIGINMKSYPVLSKENHGWVRFVEHTSCSSTTEIQDYYKRIGLILCVNYILNVYDMHYENIIAAGEFPIVIDAETILKNREAFNKNSIASTLLVKAQDSVVAQGLLPQHMKRTGRTEVVDISGMSQDAGKEYPLKLPIITNAKRSDMCITYKTVKAEHKENLPKMGNKAVQPINFLEDILFGFQKTYEYVIEHKDIAIKKCTLFDNLLLRHLKRNTQTYSMVLETSKHPDFFIDCAWREIFLMTLLKNVDFDKENEVLAVKSEIEQMLNDDIPIFFYKSNDRSLICGNGEQIKDYFENSAYFYVKNKILDMNSYDLNQQKLYIVLTILSTEEPDIPKFEANRKNIRYVLENSKCMLSRWDTNLILSQCESIADRLINNAILSHDKSKVGWIGVSMVGIDEIRWNVSPIGYGLYEGIGGIAIFFYAMMKHIIENDKYSIFYEKIENSLNEYLELILDIEDSMGTSLISGGFIGECSLMYVYLTLYQIGKEEKYLKNAENILRVIRNQIKRGESKSLDNDIIGGYAGMIMALIKFYSFTKNEMCLSLAIDAGNILLKNGKKEKNRIGWTLPGQPYAISGFSHGSSGIALSLLKLANITGEKRFYQAAYNAILEENDMFIAQFENWADRRIFNGKTGEEIGNNPVTWCHGAAGILLSRVRMLSYAKGDFEEIIKIDMERALKALRKKGGLKNQCLCHGEIGNLEIMMEYAKCTSDKNMKHEIQNILQEILHTVKTWDCNLGTGYEHWGFMLGISGIGYSLLRWINKELPCIMSLD